MLVHFDCFPNLTVALDDPHILKVLTLNIKTHGTLVLHGTRQLALIYKVYYKYMRTNMSIQAVDKRKAGLVRLSSILPQSSVLHLYPEILCKPKWLFSPLP